MSSTMFRGDSEQEGYIKEVRDQGIQAEETGSSNAVSQAPVANSGDFSAKSRKSRIKENPDQRARVDEEENEWEDEAPEAPVASGRPNRGSGRRIPFLPNAGRTSGRRRGVDHREVYPPDELGTQMGENARVWRVYLDEADEYDVEMMEAFKDTTDVLLVFAGLFSAVVTTFVAQASQALQPDYAQVTASLMTELVMLQRAMASGTSINDIPTSQLSFTKADTTTTSIDRWVNGLWFTSLSLSLVSALLSVLVKQWLQHYMSALSGTPRQRVRVRHFRFMGLQTWKVPQIIETLPVLLHMALFMFMAGLVLFVWNLDLPIASVVLTITTTCFLSYSLSNILAAIYPSCSYKTPISAAISYMSTPLRSAAAFRINLGRPDHCYRKKLWLFGREFGLSYWWLRHQPAKQAERWASENEMDNVLFSGLSWLYSSSSDPSARAVVAQSMAGLPFLPDYQNLGVMKQVEWALSRQLRHSGPDHQNLGSDLETTLLAYCATDPPSSLLKDHYDAYTALHSNVPPSIQCLPTFFHSLPDPAPLANINFHEITLPPWMWQSLFERGNWNGNSGTLGLLVEVLEMLMRPRGRLLGGKNEANWYLPPVLSLAELCQKDDRMVNVIYRYACRLVGAPDILIQMQLNSAEANDATIPPELQSPRIIVLLIQAILDRIEALLPDIDSTQLLDYMANLESALLSVSDMSDPIFMAAMHHCIVLRNGIQDASLGQSLLHQPAATPATSVLLYLLDVLQHPWPSHRVTIFDDASLFLNICSAVFAKQENEVYEAFINNNGLATFRRCFPCVFMTSRGATAALCKMLIPSLEFITRLDAQDRQHRLDIISQPDNLAWLLWLSLPDTFRDSDKPNQLRQLLRSLSIDIEKLHWLDAARILVEDLRKESALCGVFSSTYSRVKVCFDALGIVGEEFMLYGYASPAVPYNGPCFKRIVEPDDELQYGPLAVYYSSPTTEAEYATYAESPVISPSWTQRISAGFSRLKHGVFDTEREGVTDGATLAV